MNVLMRVVRVGVRLEDTVRGLRDEELERVEHEVGPEPDVAAETRVHRRRELAASSPRNALEAPSAATIRSAQSSPASVGASVENSTSTPARSGPPLQHRQQLTAAERGESVSA